MRAWIAAVRPAQWVKNAFVLVAPIFSRRLFEPETGLRTIAAVAAFALTASGVYLMNDIADRERDRLHPEKRHRPIASGAISAGAAAVVAVLLLLVGVGGGFGLGAEFGLLLALYVAIQVLYSAYLRHVVLIDVFCIASGFVIRVVCGGVAISVPLSNWLILTTIFVSLFLALCKRRAEAVTLGDDNHEHRPTLREYEPQFLDQLISVTTASLVISYSLYTLSDRTIGEFGTRNLVFTVPFVLYGVFRYLFLVHRRAGGGSPASALLGDPPLLVNSILWAATTFLVIYG